MQHHTDSLNGLIPWDVPSRFRGDPKHTEICCTLQSQLDMTNDRAENKTQPTDK